MATVFCIYTYFMGIEKSFIKPFAQIIFFIYYNYSGSFSLRIWLNCGTIKRYNYKYMICY